MYPVLNDILILLAISLPVTYLFHKLKIPAIVGFLATGIIVGPNGAGLISDRQAIGELAEIGVVLLLFTIGLEFSIRHMLSSGPRIVLIAFSQIVLSVLGVSFAGWLFHLSLSQAIFLGFLFSVSSTAIVLKVLSDRAELDTMHGKLCVGILLFQDLCIIPMMLISPILHGHSVALLAIAKQLVLAAATITILFVASRYAVPVLLEQILQIRNRDVFLVSILFICLGTAYLSAKLGLSLAIGAFIAGLVISESLYSHQILSDILPLRDTFNAIFFISIGMLVNLESLIAGLLPALQTFVALFVGKALLILLILLVAGVNFRVSWITAFSLFQVGEFSFLLARQNKEILPDSLYQLFLHVTFLTMVLTPFAMKAASPIGMRILRRLGSHAEWREEDTVRESLKDHLIVIGYGLNGKNLARVVRHIGIPFVVVEQNASLVREAAQDNVPIQFGDATQKEVLLKAGAESARMIVIAISDASASRHCVAVLRRLNPGASLLVRTRYVAEVESLRKLGADLVIPEEFETSIEIFARVLEQYRIPDHLIDQQISVIRSDGYGMLRGLSLTQERLMNLSELFLKSTITQLLLKKESAVINQTLKEIDLRNKTGATIIAVVRNEHAMPNPDAHFLLLEGDLVVLWGAHEQLAEAEKLLS